MNTYTSYSCKYLKKTAGLILRFTKLFKEHLVVNGDVADH
jgi:hypothetical protein